MSVIIPSNKSYLTDSQGHRKAVVLEIEEYNKIMDQLDELEAIRSYDKAKSSNDERILFEEAVKEIEEREKLDMRFLSCGELKSFFQG